MSWATNYINRLKQGETIQFRPRGNSMVGKINSGQLVTIEPAVLTNIQVGDIVLCRVKGNDYLHLIKAIGTKGYQIGNNKGYINGWTRQVFGKCVKVE